MITVRAHGMLQKQRKGTDNIEHVHVYDVPVSVFVSLDDFKRQYLFHGYVCPTMTGYKEMAQ